jgi:hypothetical protein
MPQVFPITEPGDESDPTGRVDLSGIAEALPFLAPSPPVIAPPRPVMPPPLPPAPPPLQAPLAVRPPSPGPSGVLASSNAAAGAAPRSATPPSAPGPALAQPLIEVVDLLWFDAAMLDRIREVPPWRGLLAALAPKRREKRHDDEAPPPVEPQDVKDRRDVFGVLADLATMLPMYRRFKARLIVELHLQQDQHESHAYALRAVALARVAPVKAGR